MYWKCSDRKFKDFTFIDVPCRNDWDGCTETTTFRWDGEGDAPPNKYVCEKCKTIGIPSERFDNGDIEFYKQVQAIKLDDNVQQWGEMFIAGDDYEQPSRFDDFAFERKSFNEPTDDCDLLQLFGASY